MPNAQNVAYDVMAGAAGYTRTHRIDNLESFGIEVGRILAGPGPVFVWLKIMPELENRPIKERLKWQTRARGQILADLRRELGIHEKW